MEEKNPFEEFIMELIGILLCYVITFVDENDENMSSDSKISSLIVESHSRIPYVIFNFHIDC